MADQRKTSSKSSRSKKRALGGEVTIRMYRQGLGDCFLLGFPKRTGGRFFVMVDCGVIQGAEDAKARINEALDDIIKTTGGFVDILAVTHEHWDHVSGFVQGYDKFLRAGEPKKANTLSVGQVWAAWTEDPNDALGRRLARERADRVKKLRAFVEQREPPSDGERRAAITGGVSSILGFFNQGLGASDGGKGGRTTGDAMNNALTLGRRPVKYLRPGDKPWQDDELPGVRVYALGPPQDEAAIKRLIVKSEVYHAGDATGELKALQAAGAAADSFFAAASSESTEDAAAEADRFQPFDRTERIPLDRLKAYETAGTAYIAGRYYGSGESDWRRIDGAWSEAAAEFALQLDSYTNNTSLVLAFELGADGPPEGRHVLLFAADAQVGSWQTWPGVKFKLDKDETVSGLDLLKRTSFYKVGHHGSHNATLKANGLELMRTDDFAVFMSVNQRQARKKRWGRMPLPSLEKALEERSKGRVVRMDKNFKATNTRESKAFAERLKTTDIYVELSIKT